MVTTGNPAAWARALHRAEAHNLIVVETNATRAGLAETLYFKARSVSRPESTTHGIAITCDERGVSVRCSCEAGQRGSVCMHSAQALRAAGLLPDLMLIEAETTRVAA